MFASLKERAAKALDKVQNAIEAVPQDALDREVNTLVDRATAEDLIAPEWGANMECVDVINNHVATASDKVLRAIKRALVRQTAKKQLLALTLLETCVKNCHAELHAHLAHSELWQEMLKMCADTSVTRVDAEVRDKILTLVEDFGRHLLPTSFKSSYEDLVDRGVDFPVRAPQDNVPFLTPPAAILQPPPAHAAADAASAQQAAPAADPFAGMTDEDRAAVQAAMSELEAEERAAQEAARVAAEADAAEGQAQRAAQVQQDQAALAVASAAALGAAGAAAAGDDVVSGAPAPGGRPHITAPAAGAGVGSGQPDTPTRRRRVSEDVDLTDPVHIKNTLETISNSTMVLSEALSTVDEAEPLPVREPFVQELADTCISLRLRAERIINSATDEALLSLAIQQHEDLNAVLGRYQELLDKAELISPSHPVLMPGQEGLAHHQAHHFKRNSMGNLPPIPEAGNSGPQPFVGGASGPAAAPASERVAEVAAAIKSKVSGAFDKLAERIRNTNLGAGTAAGAASGASSGGTAAPAPPPAAYSAAAPVAAAGAPPPQTRLGAFAAGIFGGSTAGAGAAAAVAGASAGGAGEGHFTLDDEEEDGEALLSNRRSSQQAAGAAAMPGPDLIALDSDGEEGPAAASQTPQPPAVAAEASESSPGLLPASSFPQEPIYSPPMVASPPPGYVDSALEAAVAASADAAPSAGPAGHGLVTPSGSNNDKLVEALDKLVAQDSTASQGAPATNLL